MLGGKLTLIMGAMLISTMGLFGLYYQKAEAARQILIENNAKLETAVKTNEETISSLQQDYARANAEINRINAEFSAIREQNRELSNRLAKHDLGILGSEKPALVERIINGASDKVGRCFELLSGAELTDAERNAKDAKSFNSECPWLYDSLIRN
jgi:chromosome segregation ATPase